MPNRIIKESICSSEAVNELSWFEEALFYRLIVNCDDYGCFDARPPILKGRLFPLKTVTEKQISDALNKLATAGIVRLYEYEQKPYLQFTSWARHQQIRAQKHKFPEPDINCNQMITDDFRCVSNPIQSNPIRIQSESESKYSSEQINCSEPAVIDLSLIDGSLYPVSRSMVDRWAGLYPAVDVLQELRKMVGWLEGNPKNRKTAKGVMKFVNGWLSRAQDSARASRASVQKKPANMGNFEERAYSAEDMDGYYEDVTKLTKDDLQEVKT